MSARRSVLAETPIGYDTSEDAYTLSVICEECSDEHGDGGGAAMYAGEEWGGPLPTCTHCGCILEQLIEVQS